MASTSSAINDAEPMTFTNYKPTLYKRFAEMFHYKQLTDAILICENHRIHVHKFLLSAASSFFNRMFKKPNANILHIRNLKYADVLTVLEYVYKGEVALPQERIAAFLGAAQKLAIPINEKDIESVSLKWGLTFEQQQHQDGDRDANNDDDDDDVIDDDQKSCDETKKPQNTKRTDRCETIRIDKHNLHDGNLRRIIPGVVEVSREEFFKRMFSVAKSTKKSSNPKPLNNNNNQAETKQKSSNQSAMVDPAEPSTSNGPNTGTGGSELDEKIRMRRSNIDALRKRIMRNVRKGCNVEKIEKDRLTLIKLEADLVKALKNSTGA